MLLKPHILDILVSDWKRRVRSNIILKRIGKRMEKNGTKILTKFLTFRRSRKIKFDLSFSVLIRSFDLILLMWEINICSIQRMFSIIWISVKHIHFMGTLHMHVLWASLLWLKNISSVRPLKFKTSLYNPFGIVAMTNFAQERGIFNNADVTNARDFFERNVLTEMFFEFFFFLHYPTSFKKKYLWGIFQT